MRVRRAGVASWRPFRTNSGRTAHIARGAARPGKAAAWLVALGRVAHGAGAELGVGSRPQEATEMSTPNQPRGRSRNDQSLASSQSLPQSLPGPNQFSSRQRDEVAAWPRL